MRFRYDEVEKTAFATNGATTLHNCNISGSQNDKTHGAAVAPASMADKLRIHSPSDAVAKPKRSRFTGIIVLPLTPAGDYSVDYFARDVEIPRRGTNRISVFLVQLLTQNDHDTSNRFILHPIITENFQRHPMAAAMAKTDFDRVGDRCPKRTFAEEPLHLSYVVGVNELAYVRSGQNRRPAAENSVARLADENNRRR